MTATENRATAETVNDRRADSRNRPRKLVRTLRFLLIILCFMAVMTGIGLVAMKGEGAIAAIGEGLNTHANQLLLFRLSAYLLITIGGPWLVLRQIPDSDVRRRQTIRFMWVFATLFMVGELLVIQNITAGLFSRGF